MLIVIGAKVHWSNAHEWAMSLKVKVLGSFGRQLDKIVIVFWMTFSYTPSGGRA